MLENRQSGYADRWRNIAVTLMIRSMSVIACSRELLRPVAVHESAIPVSDRGIESLRRFGKGMSHKPPTA